MEDIDKYHMPKYLVHENKNTSQKGGEVKLHFPVQTTYSEHVDDYDSWDLQPQYCKHKEQKDSVLRYWELHSLKKKERERNEKENEPQQMRDTKEARAHTESIIWIKKLKKTK